jgi:ParB family chromosome partitioning protein
VAARFGVSEAIVTKRMRLDRFSAKLLDAYREGELSLEQVQAFTVSDDHAAQERVWEGFGGYVLQPQRHPPGADRR